MCSITLVAIVARELYIYITLSGMTGKFMTVKSKNGLYYKVQYKYDGQLSYRIATEDDINRLKKLRFL